MLNNNPLSNKENLIKDIQNLLAGYEKKELCGICFKLDKDKNPLDIIGVLEHLLTPFEGFMQCAWQQPRLR